MRAVTNSDYRAHTAPLFSKLKVLDIFQINTLDIAKFMFRYHNNLLPPLFLNLFMTNSQVYTYDTRTAGNYSPVILWKKSVNLPLIATEGFSTVLGPAMYP